MARAEACLLPALVQMSRTSAVVLAVALVLSIGDAVAGQSTTHLRFAGASGSALHQPMLAADAQPDKIFWGDFEPPPANDTCETATPLVPGPAVQGTTHDATSNYNSGLETCLGFEQPGQDVVYSIAMVVGTNYSVFLSPEASFDASVSLVGPGAASVCNVVPVNCLTGSDSGVNGGPESFQVQASQSGTYYIIVDSFLPGESGSGSFSIQVTSP